ncbi:MAG: DUF1847 domain-containing protein [FCB group bacterium]|nr:DUF1847 domain-containing protein [FCB group bacterium]
MTVQYAIPLLRNRVSPRCTIADSVMLVTNQRGRANSHKVIPLENGAWTGLIRLLLENQVDTLVAGGIDRETQQMLISYGLSIVDNVACSADEVLEAISRNRLCPGYGFAADTTKQQSVPKASISPTASAEPDSDTSDSAWYKDGDQLVHFDCLKCNNRVCLQGKPCYPGAEKSYRETAGMNQGLLEVARDISCEEDRQLCRVAELVYFCLGMKYKRIGVAFCLDLLEPTGILTGLLRRFFDVFPVCCKIGGISIIDPTAESTNLQLDAALPNVACNPAGQAKVLNSLKTDLNVIVGLCMGVDCLFSKSSRAPVTTLFVKDKSLANNPIGAVYSDYYINEVTRTSASENV